MQFLYNSYIHKKPFGGVSNDEIVKMDFPVRFNIKVNGITLIIRHIAGDGDNISVPFNYSETKGDYKIYQCEFKIEKAGIYFYRIELLSYDGIWFIGRGDRGQAVRGDNLPEWQLTVYEAEYKTPKHIKGGLIYHIFVDRFHTAGKVLFRKKGILKTWDKDVTIHDADGTYLANDFFGGNLQGIIEKLDYLESLGVTLIYLSPIFESSSNHRYDTGDYMKIDELLGTEEDFKKLIAEAETRGMGVMLDGVFNHSGANSIYFNKFGNYNSIGAYQSKKSKYYDWFSFSNFPEEYHCWWGITVVPTINSNNKDYRKFLLGDGGVIDKWTKFGIKGWRLDVVDELPSDLVDELRVKVKSINPEVIIVGEVWEDASLKESYGTLRPYLIGKQLDSVMNYPFREAIIKFIKQGETAKFAERIMRICEHYPKPALDAMMNVIGTHDTLRILNVMSDLYADTKADRQLIIIENERLKFAKARLKVASCIQYMLPGVPSLYYGDEVGLQGFEDPINRRPFPWGYEDEELLTHYRRLGEIRREHRDVLLGSIRFIDNDKLSIFIREIKGESIAVISNVSGQNQVWTNPQKGVNLLNRQILNEGVIEINNLEALIISY